MFFYFLYSIYFLKPIILIVLKYKKVSYYTRKVSKLSSVSDYVFFKKFVNGKIKCRKLVILNAIFLIRKNY